MKDLVIDMDKEQYLEDKVKLMEILSVPIYPRIGADPAEVVADYLLDNEVRPTKHAHWCLERKLDGKPFCFHCSNCDNDGHYIGNKVATDYCPECGAMMDKEIQDENN